MRNRKKVKVGGIVSCLLFFILFSIGAYLYFPKGTPVRLNDLSSREIKKAAGDKVYYCLEPGDYRVLDQYEEKEMPMNSMKGLGRSVTHAYYSVLIRDKNDDKLVISVRTDKKSKDIEKRDKYQLMGWVADLSDELIEKQEKAYTGYYPVAEIIFNDSPESRSVTKAVIFAIFALISLGMLVMIIIRSR